MDKKQFENSNPVVEELANSSYKYGFTTNIANETFPKGLDEFIVTQISQKKRSLAF
jgi:hypothetical protein